jgi:hypothetical protein
MLHFKGEEVWGGLFGFGSLRKPVEWTGKDFDLHAGTRVSTEAGVATYRRVYHQDRDGRELNKISGKLSYSPLEGLMTITASSTTAPGTASKPSPASFRSSALTPPV